MSRDILKNWQSLYELTDAEKSLEPWVAKLGVRYRVQHPIWCYGVFPDFALLDQRVIFEVDDKSHNQKAKKLKDAERTAKLERLGWRVFRTSNEKALGNPKAAVKELCELAGLTNLLKGDLL